MIPQIFDEWKIKLTQDFVQQRLMIYSNSKNSETKKNVSLYSEQHLQNMIHWLIKL